MKKWIIGAALLVSTTLQLSAQHGKREMPNPEERANSATEKMSTELELSEDQRSQIMALNLDQAKKRQAEAEREAEERVARRAEMKAHQEEINSILTEEQRVKWEKIRTEQREKMRARHEGQRRDVMSREKDGN